jgi:hypothetical protein
LLPAARAPGGQRAPLARSQSRAMARLWGHPGWLVTAAASCARWPAAGCGGWACGRAPPLPTCPAAAMRLHVVAAAEAQRHPHARLVGHGLGAGVERAQQRGGGGVQHVRLDCRVRAGGGAGELGCVCVGGGQGGGRAGRRGARSVRLRKSGGGGGGAAGWQHPPVQSPCCVKVPSSAASSTWMPKAACSHARARPPSSDAAICCSSCGWHLRGTEGPRAGRGPPADHEPAWQPATRARPCCTAGCAVGAPPGRQPRAARASQSQHAALLNPSGPGQQRGHTGERGRGPGAARAPPHLQPKGATGHST